MTKYFSEKMNNHCYRTTNAFTHYIPYSLVYVTEKSRSQFYLSIPAKNLQKTYSDLLAFTCAGITVVGDEFTE